MWSPRAPILALAVSLVSLKVTTCRSPGEGGKDPAPTTAEKAIVTLPGVDTSALTAREQGDWSSYVNELLAPCPEQAVSLAQCVKESRPCKACVPAAQFLAKHVRQGKTRSQVEILFRARFAPDQVKPIEVGDSPWKGAADAPVVIVEWADFECPFCGRAAPLLNDKVKQYAGALKLVFKNYPLPSHKNSELAARAAMAARQQNKFWEMHEKLFAQGKDLDETAIKRIAQAVGLDMKRFSEDFDSEKVADAVAADRKQANALQLEGTPTIYINGRHFDLRQFDITQDLDDWIQLELELRGGAPPAPAPAAPTGSAAAPPSAQKAK
jgi:predicted DsbA family dithiol-disulfide isomerase